MASPESTLLRLSADEREELWKQIATAVERHWSTVDSGRVAPPLEPETIRRRLKEIPLDDGISVSEAVDFAVRGLTEQQVHTAHRRYFGLFNPSPATMGVAADTLVGAFNPQLAAWSHSPFAAEVERFLILELGERFGYASDETDGVFASGGAEANHTAVLVALVRHVPEYRSSGVHSLGASPTMYATAEAHDSLRKAASLSGIGFNSVRIVPTDNSLRMDVVELVRMIETDRADGRMPFLVVGTAGTTSAGIIDPLAEISEVALGNGMWFHVDAAWGGAAAMSSSARGLLAGIASSDSITFDAHKWLSVPMGSGIFLTRHPDALVQTFGTDNVYMPRDASGLDPSLQIVDPFSHSIQWSRRFIGLKLFLTLAVAGWSGYERLIDRQIALGTTLRRILMEHNWDVVNATGLPIACVVDSFSNPTDRKTVDDVVRRVVERGRVWVSSAVLSNGRACIRACITNFATDESDFVVLAEELDEARRSVATGS